MSPSQDARFLASLMAEVQADPTESMTVEAIVSHAPEVVPDAEHVSLTVRKAHGQFVTLASTSQVAETLDQLQYELHEGPCLEALEEVDWYRSGDVGADPRWPRWGAEAARAGARSLCSIPLHTRGERVGALNMYSSVRNAFSDRDVIDLASLYAIHAAYALSAAKHLAGLEVAMESRHTIGIAQGILLERYGLTPAQGFAFLRRVSSTSNRRLRDVARELAETGAIADTDIESRS